MTKEAKIKVPPIEELDEYERELCESADPNAHTALLIRLAIRNAGVDPDGNDWYISDHKMESSEQKVCEEPAARELSGVR